MLRETGPPDTEDSTTVELTAMEIERRLTAIESLLPTFATKADIQSIRADIQAVRAEWKSDLGTVTAELHAARAEWKSDLHSLTRWMVVAVLGSVTAAAAVTGLIVRFFS